MGGGGGGGYPLLCSLCAYTVHPPPPVVDPADHFQGLSGRDPLGHHPRWLHPGHAPNPPPQE